MQKEIEIKFGTRNSTQILYTRPFAKNYRDRHVFVLFCLKKKITDEKKQHKRIIPEQSLCLFEVFENSIYFQCTISTDNRNSFIPTVKSEDQDDGFFCKVAC